MDIGLQLIPETSITIVALPEDLLVIALLDFKILIQLQRNSKRRHVVQHHIFSRDQKFTVCAISLFLLQNSSGCLAKIMEHYPDWSELELNFTVVCRSLFTCNWVTSGLE
jgi:hypothetical protein